jgi:excisionase family DNA binding protein
MYNTMSNTKQFPYLSVTEVARAADLTMDSIYKHIKAGHITATKLPNFRQYMVEQSELAAFLRARANGKFVRPEKRVKG